MSELPGLRSSRGIVQLVAALYYGSLAVVLVASLFGGPASLLQGILVVALLVAPIIVYSQRRSAPLIGAGTLGQKALGWFLVVLIWFGIAGLVSKALPNSAPRHAAVLGVPAAINAQPSPTTRLLPTDLPRVSPTMTPPAATRTLAASATPQPPTSTLTPTAIPPTRVPPTSVPPTQPPPVDLDPRSDRNCSEFANYGQMQSWRRYWIARGVPNPGRLDGDGDGVACEDGEGGRPAAAAPRAPQPLLQQPAAPVAPDTHARQQGGCCKHCDPSKSKPCGDSCISLNKTCHKGAGCACGGP